MLQAPMNTENEIDKLSDKTLSQEAKTDNFPDEIPQRASTDKVRMVENGECDQSMRKSLTAFHKTFKLRRGRPTLQSQGIFKNGPLYTACLLGSS